MQKNAESSHDQKLTVRIPEAAQILSMSERKIWAMAKLGEIPSFKTGGCVLFPIEGLKQWIADQISSQSNGKGGAA